MKKIEIYELHKYSVILDKQVESSLNIKLKPDNVGYETIDITNISCFYYCSLENLLTLSTPNIIYLLSSKKIPIIKFLVGKLREKTGISELDKNLVWC